MNRNLLAIASGGALVPAACEQTGSPAAHPATTVPRTIATSDLADPAATRTPAPATPTTAVPPPATTAAADEVGRIEVMVALLGGPDADDAAHDCSAVAPVARRVDPPAVLRGASEALPAGPTAAERNAGYDTCFSPEIGWALESVTVSGGVARIDFGADSTPIDNASTSCGSTSLLAQLDSTAMQFPMVGRTVYSFGGDADGCHGWLQ